MSRIRQKEKTGGKGLEEQKATSAKRVMTEYEDALRKLADEEYARQMQAARVVLNENRQVLRKLAE